MLNVRLTWRLAQTIKLILQKKNDLVMCIVLDLLVETSVDDDSESVECDITETLSTDV